MTQIITIANQKGGVGKSTTCVSLAHGLALKGKTVLLIDLDPQGQLCTLLGLQQESSVFDWLADERNPEIKETGRERLYILPGDRRTSRVQTLLTSEGKLMTYLGTALKPVMDHYDYIVFDTSPSVGFLQGAALWVSDYLIIPSAVDFLSLEGVSKVTDTLTEIRASIGWTGKLAGIQPTFYDATKESKTILADMGEKFGKETILAPIHRAVVLRECAAYGQTIFELDQNSRAAAEYSGLVNHVLKVAR